MLDKNSIKILNFICTNGKTTIEQIYSTFANINNIQEIINFLIEIEYIKGLTPQLSPIPGFHKIGDVNVKTIYVSPYQITPKGRAYLESLEAKEKQELQEKKSNKNQLWINILINVACILLGATLDKLSEIFNWLSSLISK